MGIEIVAGIWFNSLAVLADGLHMSSHALAIGLASLAYAAARHYAGDPRFAFGTWKIEILASYTSALALLAVALAMLWQAGERLLTPAPIRYGEALLVAVLGLTVNLVSAWILERAGQHAHEEHEHPPHAHHHAHRHAHSSAPAQAHAATDLNLRAAYVHVLSDALTSFLAIAALAGGAWLGWHWLDPACALLGALLIALWAKRLLQDSARVLLDREMDHPVVDEIRSLVDDLPGQTAITDLHVWRVGNGSYACALALLTHDPALTPAAIRAALARHREIVHVTVQIERCDLCGQTTAQR
jgi:cation diffusion facilitator family transporter